MTIQGLGVRLKLKTRSRTELMRNFTLKFLIIRPRLPWNIDRFLRFSLDLISLQTCAVEVYYDSCGGDAGARVNIYPHGTDNLHNGRTKAKHMASLTALCTTCCVSIHNHHIFIWRYLHLHIIIIGSQLIETIVSSLFTVLPSIFNEIRYVF